MNKTACVFHNADFDGLFSGAIVYSYYKNIKEDIDLIGWDFGIPLVDVSDYETVVLVDLPPTCLIGYNIDDLIWIDHHQTAIEKFENQLVGMQINGVAASRLAWNYFFQNGSGKYENFVNRQVAEPLCITLVGEHDIWDHHDSLAMGFQFGLNAIKSSWTPEELADKFLLQNCDPNVIRWNDGYHDADTVSIAESGKLIEKWQENFASTICKENSYLVDFEGVKFCALVSVHARMSTWFPDESTMCGAEALMNIRVKGNGFATISLYHRDGFKDYDLSVIAKKHGGGGHKGACGFEIPLEFALKCGIIR